MIELRQHPRLSFDGRVWCEHPSLTLYLSVSNVSRGGMFLQTSAPFHAGETMRVSLEMDEDAEQVVVDVEIVWLGKTGRSAGVGCRVLRFTEGERAYERLLARLSARASDKNGSD